MNILLCCAAVWRVAHGCTYQGGLRGADLAAYQDGLGCGSGESVVLVVGAIIWVRQLELLVLSTELFSQ